MKKEVKEGIIDQILKNTSLVTTKDVNNVLDDLYGNIIQRLLETEMDEHLGYNKSSRKIKTNENRRNGYSSKNKVVKTDKGVIKIDMPRDRDGSFDPIILSKRQRVLKGYDDIIIGMYAKGLTQEDIRQMLIKIYKIDISKTLISNLISSINEEVIKWQNRKLKEIYPFIYIDCLFVPIKTDLISKRKAIYVMLGIDLEGKKEVLGIWLSETESATFWTGVLEEIKERGVEDILFVSMDGLSGLNTAIETVYPKTITQRCIVHLCRNLYKICPKKRVKEIMADFKKIYKSSTEDTAMIEFESFKKKYKSNNKVVKKVEEAMIHIIPLFEYPKEIRRVIYTTNPIESLNSALRKVTNGKGSFPSNESVMKVLYLRVIDLEKKWSKGVMGWKTILNQLIILYEKRIIKYLEI